MGSQTSEHHRIAIVGTGFSGIAAAVELRRKGETDLVLYERSGEVGGTWRDNDYPGCACDVPSHLYSFSFAPNPNWSRAFSPQPEIRDYLRRVADQYGVTPLVRTDHNLVEAAWDETAGLWRLETSRGSRTADILISAVGGLSTPSIPDIPGAELFDGPAFHSAEWDHGVDLRGKSVAVIGTGASAIQFVPEIQKEVGQLNVFQRTPPWIMPRRDRPVTALEHRLFRRFPQVQRTVRAAIYWARELFALPMTRPRMARKSEEIARRHLHHQVSDPELRAKLTPGYAIGCKRILLSNQYLRSLSEPNVELVTTGIREIRADGIVTEDDTLMPADVIILGTGFKVSDMPIGNQIRGRDGRSLHEVWQGSPNAHLGTTVNGFPNFFMLMGPNTGLGHTSVTIMIEAQVGLVTQAVGLIGPGRAATIEPTAASMDAWREEIDELGRNTVWTSGGCDSWYLDRTGRNSTLWPTFAHSFRRRLSRLEPGEYLLGSRPAAVETPVATKVT
ncbi:MAG TPA: NAD(P)/FAD-dependent oxidoreductase [Solirubrobacterales bacterium]|nr:NAD(P)/FAD-dependent oxidoreductase [Solirubrobacterales bacterium]